MICQKFAKQSAIIFLPLFPHSSSCSYHFPSFLLHLRLLFPGVHFTAASCVISARDSFLSFVCGNYVHRSTYVSRTDTLVSGAFHPIPSPQKHVAVKIPPSINPQIQTYALSRRPHTALTHTLLISCCLRETSVVRVAR